MRIRPIALTITSSTSVIITIAPQFLRPGRHFDLEFCLGEPDRVAFRDTVEGNEVVTILNGIGGTEYALETKSANVFYADRLHIGYIYRLVWNNNGAVSTTAGGLAHFLNLNTPHCSRPYNPANTVVPPAPPVTA